MKLKLKLKSIQVWCFTGSLHLDIRIYFKRKNICRVPQVWWPERVSKQGSCRSTSAADNNILMWPICVLLIDIYGFS